MLTKIWRNWKNHKTL